MFEKALPLKEMREELERLKLLESWHWDMFAKHRKSHDELRKERTELEKKMAAAEHQFVSDTIRS